MSSQKKLPPPALRLLPEAGQVLDESVKSVVSLSVIVPILIAEVPVLVNVMALVATAGLHQLVAEVGRAAGD